LSGVRMLLSSHDRGRAFRNLVTSPFLGVDRRRQCDWSIGGVDLRLMVDNESQLRSLTVLPTNNQFFYSALRELFGVTVRKKMLEFHFGTPDITAGSAGGVEWLPIQEKRVKNSVRIRAGEDAIARLKLLRRGGLIKKYGGSAYIDANDPRDLNFREELHRSIQEKGSQEERRRNEPIDGGEVAKGFRDGLDIARMRLVPELDLRSQSYVKGQINSGVEKEKRESIEQVLPFDRIYDRDQTLAMLLHVLPERKWVTNREIISDMRRNGWKGEKKVINQLLHEMLEVLWEVKSEKGYNYWRRKDYE